MEARRRKEAATADEGVGGGRTGEDGTYGRRQRLWDEGAMEVEGSRQTADWGAGAIAGAIVLLNSVPSGRRGRAVDVDADAVPRTV